MAWERDPLWAKARLFFERALEQDRTEPAFGLWCSLGLELLARAAIAAISPTLLAEPHGEHRYLLHALGRGSDRYRRRSIRATQVFALCASLIDGFTEEDLTTCNALVNRRNDELHSGEAAFEQYPSAKWLTGMYRACQALAESMDESLQSLLGDDEAAVATEMLAESRSDTKKRVCRQIARCRCAFQAKPAEDRSDARALASKHGEARSREGYHRVTCPACGSVSLVHGNPFGPEHTTDEEGDVAVRQAVAPNSFECTACGLSLQGYSELEAAEVGGMYTRTTYYSPDEYYGLIHPDDLPDHIEEYMADFGREYDNE